MWRGRTVGTPRLSIKRMSKLDRKGKDPAANGWVEQNGSETVSEEEWI